MGKVVDGLARLWWRPGAAGSSTKPSRGIRTCDIADDILMVSSCSVEMDMLASM